MDITGIFSEAFWYIAPILVTMTTFIAGLINQGLVDKFVPSKHHAWLKQLISWIIGAGLSCAAWGLKVITFGNPVWLGVICLCVVVGLASNGVYDIPFMRGWIEKWFKPKTLVDLSKTTTEDVKADFIETVAENNPIEEKPLKVKKIPTVKVSKKKPKTEVTK